MTDMTLEQVRDWMLRYSKRQVEIGRVVGGCMDLDKVEVIESAIAALAAKDAEISRLRVDERRLDWLALHPQGVKIMMAGRPTDRIFWGVSGAPEFTLREAIDALRAEK